MLSPILNPVQVRECQPVESLVIHISIFCPGYPDVEVVGALIVKFVARADTLYIVVISAFGVIDVAVVTH